MRLVRRVLLVAFLAFILAAPGSVLLANAPAVSAWSGISVELDHPSFAAKGSKIPVVLTVSGGPAADSGGNYSYEAEYDASNATGAAVTPSTAKSESGVFKLNITLPASAPQTMKIHFNVKSQEWRSNQVTFTNATFEIKVVDPIAITATVYNSGSVDAKNVSVKIYADGTLLSTNLINVTARSTQKVVYNWTFAEIKSGKHVITVTVDDPEGIVEFSDGNNVLSQTIYVGKQGNPAGVLLSIGVIIASILVALMFIAKPPRRTKKF